MEKILPSEEKKCLENYPESAISEPLPQMTAVEFLEERTKKYSNAIALTFENKVITYGELHEQIHEYTKALLKRGIRKGDKIAICMPNTPEAIYVIYALNAIGATTIGLSPLNNEFKMKRDLEIIKPKMVITADCFFGNMKKSCKAQDIEPILCSPLESSDDKKIKALYSTMQFFKGNHKFGWDSNLSKILKKSQSDKDVAETIERATYDPEFITDIMFTGGSTGVHKGVELNDNGLNCVVRDLDHVLILEPGMVHLGNIPFGHMAFGRLVMHYALCKGLTFALTLKMMPNDLYSELIRTHSNGAMGGPIHWKTLIDNPEVKKDSLSFLKQPLAGGEEFKPEDRERVAEALKFAGCEIPVGNGLGMTEAWAPTHVCVGGKNTPGTIGYPLPNVNCKVVDPNTRLEVGRNVPGLLLISGPGVMKGYYNNQEETDKVLIYDENGTKWYVTGDIVRRLDNDEFQYIGRLKRNFVCGCDNIYPEQIENLVLTLPEVKEVLVTKIPDDKYQYLPKYHIHLVDPACDTDALEKKINVLIESTLGDSALPGYIEYHTKALPKSDNNKLNPNALEQEDLQKENRRVRKLS